MNLEQKDKPLKERSTDWVKNHYWTTFAIFMFFVWGSIFAMLWIKADEVTKDPCGVCAKKLGTEVTCTISGFQSINKIFYPNFTTVVSDPTSIKPFEIR